MREVYEIHELLEKNDVSLVYGDLTIRFQPGKVISIKDGGTPEEHRRRIEASQDDLHGGGDIVPPPLTMMGTERKRIDEERG